MKARPADFDMAALHAALDVKPRALGLSWAGATRQISRSDAVPVLHPISVSSVTGTGQGAAWKAISCCRCWPGSTGHRRASCQATSRPPPRARSCRRLLLTGAYGGTSQHFMALHAALDARRRERG